MCYLKPMQLSQSLTIVADSSGLHGMADSVGLVAAKDQPRTSLRTLASGYSHERIASKAGKPRHTDRIIRDGVGASERSGRWVMAFELFAGITKLIISWSATIVLKLLAQLGIRNRPRWLLWLIGRPKSGRKDEKRSVSSHFFFPFGESCNATQRSHCCISP